ncbi:MAG: translesion DNA synthesis-associated protein ImuA [Gammaproteobacteria bacterium]
MPSGFARLDEALPDGGWPQDGLVELLCPEFGGDADSRAPLRQLGTQERWQVWINPPWLPYAPALGQQGVAVGQALLLNCRHDKDVLWAMEQCLASGSCSIVQAWPARLQPHQIRRLHLAAQKGSALGLLLRPQACAQQPSPAPLRLELAARQQSLQVRVLKRRGGWGSDWLTLKTPQEPMPMGAGSVLAAAPPDVATATPTPAETVPHGPHRLLWHTPGSPGV